MIGCLTIKQYPAWALTLVKRLDQTKPLIVQEDGYVVAVNAAAAREGIDTSMTAARARSLLPKAKLLVRDAVSEYCAWEYVLEHMHRATPFLESDRPIAWFNSRPNEIRVATSRLKASTGFAPHRSTALLAALQSIPGRPTIIREDDVQQFLDACPTRLLTEAGFSEELVEGLELLGCLELGPVRLLTPRQLKLAFGQEADALLRVLHPDDAKPVGVFHPSPTIRRHFELEAPCSQPGQLLPIVTHLVEKTTASLKDQFAGQIRITLIPQMMMPFHGTRVLPHPTSRLDTIQRYAIRLATETLQGLASGNDRDGGPPEIDRVDFTLASLMMGDLIQESLFGQQKREVTSAVGEVHRRYPNALRKGIVRSGAHFHEDRFRLAVWETATPKALKTTH